MLRPLVLLCLALSIASLPVSSALAQSAGDNQYVDPFQGEENANGQGGGDSAGQGETPAGSGEQSVVPAPDPVIAEQANSSEATAIDAGDGAGGLPNTGLPAALLAALGAGLLAGGTALRRRA